MPERAENGQVLRGPGLMGGLTIKFDFLETGGELAEKKDTVGFSVLLCIFHTVGRFGSFPTSLELF